MKLFDDWVAVFMTDLGCKHPTESWPELKINELKHEPDANDIVKAIEASDVERLPWFPHRADPEKKLTKPTPAPPDDDDDDDNGDFLASPAAPAPPEQHGLPHGGPLPPAAFLDLDHLDVDAAKANFNVMLRCILGRNAKGTQEHIEQLKAPRSTSNS